MSVRVSFMYTAAAASLVAASSASAENVTNWATWIVPADTFTFNTVGDGRNGVFAPGATGTVVNPQDTSTINMVVSGEIYDYPGNPGFVWNLYPAGDDAYTSLVSPTSPVGEDMLAQTGYTEPTYQAHTLTFSENVTNAVMGIWSLGNPSNLGQLTFSQPFTILSENNADNTDRLISGGDAANGYKLDGYEGMGVIQFLGTYDTISWIVSDPEVYVGFSLGLTKVDNDFAGVPVEVYQFDPAVLPPTFAEVVPTGLEPLLSSPAPTSVLERVLAAANANNINMLPLTGTFLNVAENIAVLNDGGTAILNAIDGSVTNTLGGVTSATASVGDSVLAIDQVTVDIGNVSTTVLGAVNTGTTSLGVNSDYNKAITRTSSAVSGKVLQLGGMSDQAALVLNVASNATSVVGSVTNSFTALNGSVGNIGTTVLGAVNTGNISSGIKSITNGVVSGVVGG